MPFIKKKRNKIKEGTVTVTYEPFDLAAVEHI
jgi:hypothetical protein